MLPARDRVTVLKVYPTKADAKADTNGTSYTEGIVNETPRIERTFFTKLPAFGECNAAMFECELQINVDLTGKWIRVATQAYATDDATTRTTYWMFLGKVDTCKYDVRQATRKLVAYDEMYTLRNTDASDWWKTYWASQSGSVASNTVLSALMSQFGLTGGAATSYGAYFNIIASYQNNLFSGCSVAQMLSYFGLVKPCSFYFSVSGTLEICDYSSVNKTNTPVALDGYIDTNNSSLGDEAGAEFGSACINVGSETAYRDGSTEPMFTQTDNPLLGGQNASTYVSIVQNLLVVAKKMSGLRGAEIEMIVSTNDVLERTKAVSYDNIVYMPSAVEFSGSQMINEIITCTGELANEPSYRQAVTSENIVDGAVKADKIEAGAISTDKLAVGAVTSDKINSSVDMATNAGVASTYATKSDAIKREQKLYRRTSTTSTPATPTSWITTSMDVNNAWTTKPIAYNTTYKYLWVCWQRQTVSGTLSCTTPVRDATITVIDGGNIITGTVTADQISVTDLEALDATIGGWTINETNLASSNNAVVLNSAGTINVTETGTSAEGAKFIAESSTDKAYYSAWGVRVENPPNMGTGNGTKALLRETGLVSETMASGGVFHGVALTDTSGNPALTLIDRSSSEEWKNQQTEQDIKITHTDKSVSPNVVDKTMQLDKNGLYQLNKDGTKDYMAHISPHASSSSGYVSRSGVSASDSSTLSSSYILDTVHTENFATIEAHAQKTEGNNVTWSSDSAIETTNMNARINLQGYQGASATLAANNNLGNAGGSGYETASLSLETGSTAVTNRNDWATAALSVTRANNSGSSKLSLRNRLSGTTHASEITPQTLKIDSHDLLRMSPHFAQMFATEITGNANLNTTEYLKCGQYYCSSTSGFTNSPTGNQFVMEVAAMIYNRYDDESETADAYRIRKITDYVGNQFIQRCIKPTNGSWDYGAWKLIITSDSFPTVSASGNITSSTTLAYTGKAITIPSDGYWAISGYAQYGYSQPQEIGIAGVSGSYLQQYAYATRATFPSNTATLATSYTGYFTANMEVRLYARHARADSNYVAIQAKKIP